MVYTHVDETYSFGCDNFHIDYATYDTINIVFCVSKFNVWGPTYPWLHVPLLQL